MVQVVYSKMLLPIQLSKSAYDTSVLSQRTPLAFSMPRLVVFENLLSVLVSFKKSKRSSLTFIAFIAAIELLRETRQEHIINEVYKKSKAQEKLPKEKVVNYVKEIYEPFSAERISGKISELVTPAACRATVQIVYQTIPDLHEAIPNHRGDWYFTGDYPTPGGNKVVNRAFINYIEGRNIRAY